MLPDCAALARIASWAASVTLWQGRLFCASNGRKHFSQEPTLRGSFGQMRQALKLSFSQPQWHVFHHHRVEMGQPGLAQTVFSELKSRTGGFRGTAGWTGALGIVCLLEWAAIGAGDAALEKP